LSQANYLLCPKCSHTPLPADQSLPAACPACGLVLAKYALALVRARKAATFTVSGSSQPAVATTAEESGTLRELLFHVPPRVDATRFWARAALLPIFAIWGMWLIGRDFRDGEIGASFLHGPLLVFHEAGHVIFRLFGEFLMILGGTLGQLLMPAILAGALLLKNRDPFGASIGLWLLGVSFLDIAPYVYDALQPQLMLLSGTTGEEGGHDWIYLLNAMGLLKHAHGLGWFTHKLGAGIVLLALAWGSFMIYKQHGNKAEVLNEEEL
jgi:hypothetical protein